MMIRSLTAALAICICAALPALPVAAAETGYATLREQSLNVLDDQFGAFQDATDSLAQAARDYCSGDLPQDGLSAALRAARLTWAPLDSYQFGPIEQTGAALTVNFWPDKKNFVGRGLTGLLTLSDEQLSDPGMINSVSAAAQGLPAIELLLAGDQPECPAIIGISAHLQGTGRALYQGWFGADGWADLARSAGPDNPVYLSDAEFIRTLLTAVEFGLSRIADARLGRPLGSFDHPFPGRVEARETGLALDIIMAQMDGLEKLLMQGFGTALHDDARAGLRAQFDDVRARIAAIGVPLDQAVSDPMTRIRVEGLETQIRLLQLSMIDKIGAQLGVQAGFSAGDGD